MIEHFKKVLLCLLVYLCIPVVVYSQDYIITNEEVYRKLTQQVLDSFLVSIHLSRDDTIILKYQNDEKTKFLNEFILDYLKNIKQFNLKIHSDNIVNGNILEYFITRLDLSYSKPFREKLFGKKLFLRNINTEISIKYIKDYDLVSYKTISTVYTDTVRYAHIKNIENSLISLTMTKLPNDTTLERYVMPVITITTVSVIVYLFFIIRK